VQKPRVVVTTDPELDDSNSLIRYLLYATDFRTEGLVYASSQFHWKGDGSGKTWAVPNREYFRFGLDLFAARMKWSVTPTWAGANHEPTVALRGSARVSARPGETVRLEATDDGRPALTRYQRVVISVTR
jgi:hypothetical protein